MKLHPLHVFLAIALALAAAVPAVGQFEVFNETPESRSATAPAATSVPVSPAVPPAAEKGRVLMLLADDFAVTEFWWPYYALRAAGYSVDVAALAAGNVRVDDRARENDAQARLSFDDADFRSYAGLVIPGGRCAEKLEKFPRAVELCRQFAEANKVVAAAGQGPRLLVKAGVLKGRFATHHWQLPGELADDWKAGALGYFVDDPAVVDGSLVTGRGGDDLLPYMQEVIRVLNAQGKPGPLKSGARVVVINPAAPRHLTWAFSFALEAGGCSVRTVATAELKNAAPKLDANDVDGLVVLEGRELAELADSAVFAQWLEAMTAAKRPVLAAGRSMDVLQEKKLAAGVVGLVGRPDQQAADAMAQLAIHAKTPEAPAPAFTAAIALHAGCDEKAVAALKTTLSAAGHRVLMVAARRGYVRGMHGLPLKAEAAYGDTFALPVDAVVIAPGGLWPRSKEHQARLDWLLARYKAGARLVVCGYDNVYIAADAAFAGKSFAAPDQAQWSFARDGGQYAAAKAVAAAERVVSVKDYEALADSLKLLADWKP